MNITTDTTDNGIHVLHIKGNLDSNAAQALETALWNLIEAGVYQILVDLQEVSYVSSGGLRTFLAAHKEVIKHEGGALCLYGANDYVYKIFDLAGFTEFFTLAPDQAAAESAIESTAQEAT